MKKPYLFPLIAVLFLVIFSIYWVNTRKTTGNSQPQITQMYQKDSQQITEKSSSDGSIKLTEISQKDTSGNNRFTFTVKTKDNSSKTILETVENPEVSFIIPDNSWAPDNKQFFIERVTPSDIKYLVFKADGSKYSGDLTSLDIGSFWSNTKTVLKIKTVTGWASEDLIVVYTIKQDGTSGPSFWFVTSSKKFLQLSQ